MKPRRRHSGLLSGMVKYPQDRHHKGKPPSLARRVGTWVVGTVVVVALAGFLVVLFWQLFHPESGTPDTGDFPVMQLVENPPGYPPEAGIVASAYVPIRGKRVPIPLTAATRKGVVVGATLHVEYTWRPKYQRVTVERWNLAEPAATSPSSTPAVP